jgi:hypothetical protein
MTDRLWDKSHQERDSVRSLEVFVEMLALARDDSYYWKWAIIALQNACHGFMVLALEGTWPVRLLPEKARRKVLRDQYSVAFDDRVFTGHIMGFMDLFASVQSDDLMRQNMRSEAFISTDAIQSSMQELNDIRNKHIHFRAETHLWYVPAFVPMSVDVLQVIDFLLNESGNIWWTRAQVTGELFRERSVEALRRAREQLSEIDAYYLSLRDSEDHMSNTPN